MAAKVISIRAAYPPGSMHRQRIDWAHAATFVAVYGGCPLTTCSAVYGLVHLVQFVIHCFTR